MSRSFLALLTRIATVAVLAIALLATTFTPQPASAAEDSDGPRSSLATSERPEGDRPGDPSISTEPGERPGSPPLLADLSVASASSLGCDVTFTFENSGDVPSNATTIEWTDSDGTVYSLNLGALAVGSSQTFTITTTPGTTGTNIAVVADPTNVVNESNEGNNTFSFGLLANCDQFIDLSIASVIFLADCTVEMVIENLGTADVTGLAELYVQGDSSFTSVTIPTPLVGGGTVTVSGGTWPSGDSLDIIIDPFGSISGEQDSTNNSTTVVVPSPCGAAPDLTILNPVWVGCTAIFDIANIGAADLTLSSEFTYLLGSTTVSVPISAPLPAGDSTVAVAGPIATASLDLVVDPSNTSGDADPTNNALSLPTPAGCVPIDANLTVSWSFPASNCIAEIVVTNAGPDNITDDFDVDLGNGSIVTVNGLANGSTQIFTLGPAFNSTTSVVEVDVATDVIESDEGDNTDTVVVPAACIEASVNVATCGSVWVNVFHSDGGYRIQRLDANGELEHDFGTVTGLEGITDIGFIEDQLYAWGWDSAGTYGSWEITLLAGTASATLLNITSSDWEAMGHRDSTTMLSGFGISDAMQIDTGGVPTTLGVTMPVISPGQRVLDATQTAGTGEHVFLIYAPTLIDPTQVIATDSAGTLTSSLVVSGYEGLADTGTQLIGIDIEGRWFDATSDSLISGIPAYANSRKVKGAAAYWDVAICGPLAPGGDPGSDQPVDEGSAGEGSGGEGSIRQRDERGRRIRPLTDSKALAS